MESESGASTKQQTNKQKIMKQTHMKKIENGDEQRRTVQIIIIKYDRRINKQRMMMNKKKN